MNKDTRRTVSRRNLFKALLGRDTTPGHAPDRPEGDIHAAGDAAYETGDYAAAVDAYRASIHADLSNTAVRARLGYALYVTGQYIQARVEFEHVLRLTAGGNGFARLGLGLTWLGLGKTQRAASVLAAFEDTDRPELVQVTGAIAARLAGDETPDCEELRLELERTARATAFLPEILSV